MAKKYTKSATFAALLGQIIFGFSFMFTAIALKHRSPMTVIANRYMVAFLGLTIAVFITKTKLKFNKNIWKLVLMAVFQPFLYYILETLGLKMTTSSFSSVMMSLVPVFSMLFGVVFLREVPSFLQYVFTFLSIGGVTVMAVSQSSDGIVTLPGVALLFGAVLASVGYNVASRKISSEFSVFERTYAMAAVGLVSFCAIAFFENLHNPTAIFSAFLCAEYLVSILYLGVFSSILAFLCLNYANTHLPVAKTTVFSSVTTLVSVFAGVVFLNEKFSFVSVVSTILIIVGVLGVQLLSVKKN